MGAAIRSLAQLPFFVGMARALDMFGALSQPMAHERHRGDPNADAAALFDDWVMVGGDFTNAVAGIEKDADAPVNGQ